MVNNYFITGAKRAGKSTLLARLLQKLDKNIAGFAVGRIEAENSKPLLFKLIPAADLKEKGADFLNKKAGENFSAARAVSEDEAEAKRCQETFELFEGAPASLKLSTAADDSLNLLRHQKIFAYREKTEDKFKINPKVFDSLGVELLKAAGEVVVLDELGRFELEAEKFKRQVFSLLSSEKIVIGVIKAESNPFLDKIRQRADLKIYHLKEENSEEIYDQLLANLKELTD